MARASKVVYLLFRLLEITFAATIIGILGNYLRLANEYHTTSSGILIYTQVIAILSLIIAIPLIWPWSIAKYTFPLDFALFIMWMVAFGLVIHVSNLTASFISFLLQDLHHNGISHGNIPASLAEASSKNMSD